jgi:hypothetical protein
MLPWGGDVNVPCNLLTLLMLRHAGVGGMLAFHVTCSRCWCYAPLGWGDVNVPCNFLTLLMLRHAGVGGMLKTHAIKRPTKLGDDLSPTPSWQASHQGPGMVCTPRIGSTTFAFLCWQKKNWAPQIPCFIIAYPSISGRQMFVKFDSCPWSRPVGKTEFLNPK